MPHLTSTHARYWADAHAPTWARRFGPRTPDRAIHLCINDHAAMRRPDYERQAGNTLELIRLMRRRMPVSQALHTLTLSSAPASDQRRAARCRKWLRHLGKGAI